MRSIQRKLHSERGASFLIALLFFLICLTMGSLILTAATANAVKAKDRYENQQNYLAAASAARLIKDTIGNYTYTEGKTWQSWQTGIDPATGLPIMESGWKKITPFLSPDDEGDLLTDAYDDTGGLTEYRGSFEIKADEGMPGVQADFAMEQGGDATIVLTAGEYSMTVSFTARTAHTTDHTTYDYYKTSWSSGVITKGAD